MKKMFFILISLSLLASSCKKNTFDTGKEDGVNIPNWISPNSDGNYDVWRITTPIETDGRIIITDQNNLVVFETGDITDGWEPYPGRRDLYHYFIKLHFADGKKKKYTGSILVLK
ncbi:MAG: gliding motility-associated C-terminal domain-containing protein [Bacteroidota bacterium]